jgi:hypothetical protein
MSILRSRNAIAVCMAMIFPMMSAIAQENHVVPLAELHRDAAAVTASRQGNLEKAEHFFSSDLARKALGSAGIDGEQVKAALPLLDNEDLARLAARTDQVQADFAAGALSNLHLTYIVIALATALIVLLIVAR